MEISFKIQGEVQVVEIDGVLSDPEAAAIRVKLEQKINQGRKKILFDLSNFPVENNAARNLLLGIISYSLNRGATTAMCGVKAIHRPLMVLTGNQQAKVFFTRAEGIAFLQKYKTEDLSKGGPKTEEEIKENSLKKLLEKYEPFQHSDDDDPFRLQFLFEQYTSHPNSEALMVEKRATESFLATQEENRTLDDECEALAKQVKMQMLFRKSPLSGKELQLKQESLDKEILETNEFIEKTSRALVEMKKKAEDAKKLGEETKRASIEALQDLEKHIKSTLEAQAKEATELQRIDTQEQANFDAIANKPK